MKLNLEIEIGKIKFKNPVLVASGTFGHAGEFKQFIDLKKLGGIVTKTITLKPRLGNPPQRIVETPSGMLNSIGLQNPGVEKFIEEKLPYLQNLRVPIIVSVMGYSIEEFTEVIKKLEETQSIHGYELNLSCPNVAYKETPNEPPGFMTVKMFAQEEGMIAGVVRGVRGVTRKTLIAKLGPEVSDIGAMASAAERAGADAVSLVHTFVAMAIDVKTRRPVLANKTGGLSGPCIRPIAVRMVWEASRAVKIPVIGIGGIMDAHDALEFLIAGASAIQVGTANFINPRASIEILEGLKDFMKKEKLRDLKEIIGSLRT
ncbi:MAG: dihydroorotate dehydrogenase [Candidatus Omnitrophica bacterium]|nr:dihydroorotate dehydrogenase [Candidatus Omnitrophota bacterium]